MKKVVHVEYQFEEGDMELLKKGLPKNPCETCGVTVDCCGCQAGEAYGKIVTRLKENNLLEVAEDINKLKKLNIKKEEIDNEIVNLRQRIPREVFESNLL